MSNVNSKASKIAIISMMSAISIILYFFAKFPIPFLFPSFLDIQLSDIPALITTFALGLPSGIAVLVIKILIKLPFSGTAYVGEMVDLIIGLAYIIPAGLIYKRLKTYNGAFLALLGGTISCIVVAMLANRYIAIPFYVKAMFNGNWDILLGMCRGIFPNITIDNFYTYYIFGSILPFNLLRCTLVNVVTLLVYKRMCKMFNYLDRGINKNKIDKKIDIVDTI